MSLLLLLLLAQNPTASEEAQARVPLERYLQGHATGDGSHMRLAFLPTAHIEVLRQGKFTSWTVEEYIKLFSGPSPEESRRKRWIEKWK